MENIFAVILVLIKYFFSPEQIKKREERKIERDAEKFKMESDKYISEFDSLIIASDIDRLLEI